MTASNPWRQGQWPLLLGLVLLAGAAAGGWWLGSQQRPTGSAVAARSAQLEKEVSRLRGRVDTEGRVAAFLEERVNVGVNFVLSAEVDHAKKDYKFGLGMTVGE